LTTQKPNEHQLLDKLSEAPSSPIAALRVQDKRHIDESMVGCAASHLRSFVAVTVEFTIGLVAEGAKGGGATCIIPVTRRNHRMGWTLLPGLIADARYLQHDPIPLHGKSGAGKTASNWQA
jgi:hypothetical protein